MPVPGHASHSLWGLGKGLSLCLPELCIFSLPGMVQRETEQLGQGELWGWGTRVHARQLSLEFCSLHHIDRPGTDWHTDA